MKLNKQRLQELAAINNPFLREDEDDTNLAFLRDDGTSQGRKLNNARGKQSATAQNRLSRQRFMEMAGLNTLREEVMLDFSTKDESNPVFDDLKRLAPNVDVTTLVIGGLDPNMGPDDGTSDAYIDSIKDKSGRPLTDQDIDKMDSAEVYDAIVAIAIEFFNEVR